MGRHRKPRTANHGRQAAQSPDGIGPASEDRCPARHVLDPAGAIAAKFFAIVESVMTHRLLPRCVAHPCASLSQSARWGARIMADLPDPVAQVLPVFFNAGVRKWPDSESPIRVR